MSRPRLVPLPPLLRAPLLRVPLPRALHTADRPSTTAQWTALGRAVELQRAAGARIVGDVYAPVFLSGINRRALAPLTSAAPLVQRLERTAAARVATSALCRHAFIDAHLLESLPEVEQIVILGAGYDSRAYRFARAIGRRPVFEVDLAPTSRAKAEIVRAHPDLFSRGAAQRVEIDFRTQTLPSRLAESGFRLGVPTFVAWEGVTMYLTRAAVLETLDALALVCGSGSVLTMDCWQHVAQGRVPTARLRRTAVSSMRLIGEPVTFALPAEETAGFLSATGFRLRDQATARTLTTRFATGGRVCDEGLYAIAATLG